MALKLANLASLDETLHQSGMGNASSLDRAIWSEFFYSLQQESRAISIEPPAVVAADEDSGDDYIADGTSLDKFGISKQRSRQELFRRMVLAAYDFRCAVTGIEQPELLVAGHIKPWAAATDRRLDPRNGICLNRLHDRAFDEGLITFENDGRMLISRALKPETRSKMLQMASRPTLKMPRRFLPDPELLQFHRENIFQRP